MKYILKNNNLCIEVDSHGAELTEVTFQEQSILYTKHPDFWQRQSPVLFPVVGGLKNKEYFYKNQKYSLPQHGFARDEVFECEKKGDDFLQFVLRSNEKTRRQYPFDWELRISYFLEEYTLKVHYEVKNLSENDMYYSLGGHPAFQIRANINQYLIDFGKNMNSQVIDRIHPEKGLLDESFREGFPISQKGPHILELNEKFFAVDALIFRNAIFHTFDFYHQNAKIFTFSFDGFPHFGIWKQPNSPFICFEPWDGYVDTVDATGNIEEKAGIQKLKVGGHREYSWTLQFERKKSG